MAIDFPSSPNINDTHTDAGRTWKWDGISWRLEGIASNYTHPNHSGDVTSSGDGATTITDDVIEEKHINAGGTVGADKVLVYDSNESTNWKWADQSSTAINNNADNRIITGSATAGTLNGEASLTYDGLKIDVSSTDGSGQSITSSGIIKAGTHLEATGRLSVNENIQSNGFTYTQSTNSLVVDGSISDGADNVRKLSNNNKTVAYDIAATDVGGLVNTSDDVTILQNIFNPGDAVTIYNNNTNSDITITKGSGVTMYLCGQALDGDRTLAKTGICTVVCVSTNTFVISGAGLT